MLRTAPENLAAIRGLAEIHRKRGDLPEALTYFRSALRLARHDPDLEQTVDDIERTLEPGRRAPEVPGGMTFEQASAEFLTASLPLPVSPSSAPGSARRPPCPTRTLRPACERSRRWSASWTPSWRTGRRAASRDGRATRGSCRSCYHHTPLMAVAPPADALSARHRRLRAALAAEGLDALVVTHLPNVFYLTGFRSTAGIVVLGPNRLYLIVDFRYGAAVDALLASPGGCPGATAVRVERSYDDTLVALLGEQGFARVGIEGAHLPVARWQRLAAAGRGGGAPLVVTEGMVERIRVRKDPHEIDMLRIGAGLLSDVARELLPGLVPGRREREVAADVDWRLRQAGFERPAFDTIVAGGPHSAMPHARPGDRLLESAISWCWTLAACTTDTAWT